MHEAQKWADESELHVGRHNEAMENVLETQVID